MRPAEAAAPARSLPWRSSGLRWGAGFAAILGGCLLAMFALMYWRSTALLFDTMDRSVLEQLELLAARPPDLLPFMIESRMHHQPRVVTQVGLFDQDGRHIVGDIETIPAGLVLNGRVQAVAAPGDEAVHWRAAGRRLPSTRILVVARGADEILNVRQDLVRGAAIGIVPAILLSLLGGALVGVATERRLRRFNDVAARIIEGQLHERLPVNPKGDELDRLCAIVNRMLGRLEEAIAALKGVGDNIAHDLRTPLTALRARLERAQRLAGGDAELGWAIGKSIDDVQRALSIVTALLRISDIRHIHRQSAFAPLDLGEIVRETAENYEPVAEDKGVRLLASVAAPPVIVVGDRQLLTEALVNLVDNAVKFTPAGGTVELRLERTARGPLVTVSDTGRGIAPAVRGEVFKRFYREDASRSTPGSGLGLSLVAEVMRLHRFAIELSDNNPGCRVEMRCWHDGDGCAMVAGARDGRPA
ncbi:MAG: hypothetical protein ABS99_03940 [Acetobacteraceae bacterium SCN 69-10]|mgnify:CR=1 FL=1|nr:HAMP domain-containing protein [Rhodospirillales bacterium]ODU59110.1 MAG: hypothetical protein ABS99_03940 [Acetobacteraceae bacterium SCN 69-10]OJY76203.1 MAG: hypothetical protein BGP12_01510 [Rhodospirillales bacterium 70-18]